MRTPELHYTDKKMVRDLIRMIPLTLGDRVLDAGSGRNKTWYKELCDYCVEPFECEIEDGVDFLLWRKSVDWVIGNPPFSQGYKFVEHASIIANKGMAFLGSGKFINSLLLPNRLERLKEAGFYINSIRVVQDKRWYGRYYFIVFTRNERDVEFSWELNTYKGEI